LLYGSGEYQAFSKAARLPQQREKMNVLYGDSLPSRKDRTLEKTSESGIIERNRTREIPER
jgi:hypothetical protein